MTLIDAELLPSLEAGSQAKKAPMAATLQAFDGQILANQAALELSQVIVQTAAQWAADGTTILNIGQRGYESDTNQIKFGDGVNTWSGLQYFAPDQIIEVEATYADRRTGESQVVLGASDRVLTASSATITSTATVVKTDGAASACRVHGRAAVGDVFAVIVDPDSTNPVTLERTEDVLLLSGNVSGTSITNVDTRNVTVGQAVAVYKDTGTVDEFDNPIRELISNPAAVIDSITLVSEVGSLEMDLAASEAATGADVEIEAGEQGLINGSTAALTLLPGTSVVRVFKKEPWTELLVEGPEIGRFVLGTTITAGFDFQISQRGQTIQVNSGSDVACTLNAMPVGTWARFIVRGAGKLTFTNGTATADFLTGKIASVPSHGNCIIEYLGETDVFISGTLEDAP